MKTLVMIMTLVCFCATGASADVFKVPLHKLAPTAVVDLKCILGEYELVVPVPTRWKARRGVLTLKYTNSGTLLQDKSELVVKMNGQILGQIGLSPRTPEGRVVMPIPGTYLKSDYNTLSFHCAQHYAVQCEQFCAPNLWTTLDLYDSSLEISYDPKPVPLRLSEMNDFLFDPKIWSGGDVNIVTEDLSADAVSRAVIAAAGIARKFDYRKVSFSISHDIHPEKDNILIGSKSFAGSSLKKHGMDLVVSGPTIRIMHLPLGESTKRETRALIVIAGEKPADIVMAAETFAHMTLPYPAADQVVVQGFALPDVSRYAGRRILTPDKQYSFKTLGFDTHTFSGFSPTSMDISFRLPSDFLIKPNQYAKIKLNFAYGAGMRDDSVLNVLVNDKTVGVIHLKNASGESIEGYRVELPTYLFKAGYNAVRFIPILNPVVKECDLLRPEGFFLTIFGNSTFIFPAMPHFVEMPKIELTMVDGFPFTRMPDGSETLIYLPRPDQNTVSAALNMIGVMSQKNGYPLFRSKVTFDRPSNWQGELIIAGDVASIPEDMRMLAPLKLAQTSVIPYPVIRDLESEPSFAYSKQAGLIGPDLGALMEFQSPYKIGSSIMLVTGISTREVSSIGRALLDSGVQDKMKGDLMLIDLRGPEFKTRSLTAGNIYFTGKSAGILFLIEYYLYKYPYLNYALLSLLILLVSLAVLYYLRKRKKKRLLQEDA